VIECDPAVNVEVLSVALPWLTVSVPSVVGGVVLPSMNVTVPVAVVGATVAVNFTDEPYVDGFTEELSVTVVLTWFTVCVSTGDVLPL